jgi:hypothetical protein
MAAFTLMSFHEDVLKLEMRCSNLPAATSMQNIEDNGEDDSSHLSLLESESRSVHLALSSSASSADAQPLQPTLRRKKRVQPEIESFITRNEEMIALERRKLDILDKACAREQDDDLLFFFKVCCYT